MLSEEEDEDCEVDEDDSDEEEEELEGDGVPGPQIIFGKRGSMCPSHWWSPIHNSTP